jgi:hypothetical protein
MSALINPVKGISAEAVQRGPIEEGYEILIGLLQSIGIVPAQLDTTILNTLSALAELNNASQQHLVYILVGVTNQYEGLID